MKSTEQYREAFLSYLSDKITLQEPRNLYEPMLYMMGLGGKRVRPVLVLMAADIFSDDHKKALDAALAIEIFHNFSLVHDDIMDDAPLRRGKSTVHERWDLNTGILSGDAMLILAYQLFEHYESSTFQELAKLFSKTALEVCEGQQYDLDFQTREVVEIQEYLKMIEYKTAVLVGASLKMGAIVANAAIEDQERVYEFGRLLGIAFQLQDDYLDAFGDPATFGKQVGGDIIENKKTFLYLTALKVADPKSALQLEHLYSINPPDPGAKVEDVRSLFKSSGAAELTLLEIKKYTEQAFQVLDDLEIPAEKKTMLRALGQSLMNREV